MLNKITVLFIFIFLLLPSFVFAQSQKVDIYFFYSNTCPHCAKEELFLDKLEDEYSNILNIYRYEVSNDKSIKLLNSFAQKLNADVRGVPFTVVGDVYFEGYYDDKTTGEQIKLAALSLVQPIEIKPPSFVPKQDSSNEFNAEKTEEEVLPEQFNGEAQNKKINQIELPSFFGFDLKNAGLPFITIALGILDGFNPCAMWALLFLISLLLGMKDKKRMWVLGTTFIVTSALVYFLFMAAWLNLILFLGFVDWIRILISFVAIGGGIYNIYNFFVNKSGACKVNGGQKKKKVFEKLKEITSRKEFLFAIIGIILLAIAVNMVELICSAGLPAVYAQVLAINNLNTFQYYAYIGLYILFFMLDDLLVFFVAMITLRMTGLSTKYARISNIVGGILMFLIGLALMFKPELLMFA